MQSKTWVMAGGALLLICLGIRYLLPSYPGGSHADAQQIFTRSELSVIQEALDQFRLDMGRYPYDAEGLAVLLKAPTAPDAFRWKGPYFTISTAEVSDKGGRMVGYDPCGPDLWGNRYVYHTRLGSDGGIGYAILSYGPRGFPLGSGAIIATDQGTPVVKP